LRHRQNVRAHSFTKISSTKRRKFSWHKITIDLTQPEHRRNLALAFAGLSVMTIALALGAYQGYAYSESSAFCGTTCHTMDPQFSRYKHSPHANVACVDCHVGSGFRFYIRSKIEGLRQVYALATKTYSRPIKSPVHNLRPAREICETCHTPALFQDNVVKVITHYDNDEANTPIVSTLILKMGGKTNTEETGRGIHWHVSNPVYYLAADEQRQVILWVGVENQDGSIKEYFSRDVILQDRSALVESARANGEIRKMDCIDCHNRIAHEIPPPERVIDEAITSGLIDTSLPFIRAKSVEVLDKVYVSQKDAFQAINGLLNDYQANYPKIVQTRRPELDLAISELKTIYMSTNFPDMNLNWETNPNNQDHSYSLGCFRCHDDRHVSIRETGEITATISASCNLCHTVPIIGKGRELLVEAPVIVGSPPASHTSFSWTVDHQSMMQDEQVDCLQCHGTGFCNNGVCHNLSHPPDMLFTHADEYRRQGNQACYICHQDISCSRCHPQGVVNNP
jgi:nitrate/TMAO reductase-like tetraheme cytochrome c subunit